MIKILVADDQPGVRAMLRLQLALEADFDVVGDAADGAAAIDAALSLHPDVVVMDAHMPVLNGIAAAAQLRDQAPAIRVVILTLHDDLRSRALAQQAGVAAFVAKHEPAEMLLNAIRAAASAPSTSR